MTRKPRARQRFPEHGAELYELMREAHEPDFIRVMTSVEVNHELWIATRPDLLVYDKDADPMVYFWPVEHQHANCVWYHSIPAKDFIERLAKALFRDGAIWVSVMYYVTDKVPIDRDRWREVKRLVVENHGHPGDYMALRYGQQ